MKAILSIIISGALVVSGYAQTRNVLVGTNNVVVQPTNFWSADASNARTGLGLGSAATNPASAFQSSSAILSNISSSNGIALTNIQASNIVGTIAISNGGSGATTAGGARTNLGLGATNNVQFNTIDTRGIFDGTNEIIDIENNFLNYAGFGATLEWQDSANTTYVPFAFGGTNAALNAAITRTNFGLGWPALTNSNSGTGLVSVNTNGEVVSPTNFWQAAPITTTFIESQPTTNFTTNISPARFLHIHSLSTNIINTTNTIVLPTNTLTFEGDVAIVVHKGPTNSMTRVQRAGSTNNLITLTRFDEAVQFVYYNDVWQFDHNVAFVEPIYFSGTNAAANAAESRTNLGLGATWLTNTNVTNFRTAIGLGATNNPVFFEVDIATGNDTATLNAYRLEFQSFGGGTFLDVEEQRFSVNNGSSDIYYYSSSDFTFHVPIAFNNNTNIAITRTNLGLPLAALTNTSVTNFQKAIFYTNTAPSNIGGNLGTIAAWIEIVASNGVTYKIPAYTNIP